MKGAAAAAALLLALAGCTAGPNYHVPDNAVALQPPAQGRFLGAGEKPFSEADLPPHWWRLYDDARLDGYVAEALAANTDLRAADANLRRTSFIVREAQTERTLQTSISGGLEAAQVGGYTLPLPGTAYAYTLGVGLSYPLDLAGRIRRGIEEARANSQAAAAARDEVRVTVAAAVTRSYAAICSANRTLAATRRVIDVQRQTVAATQRLFRGGRGTSFDVVRSRAAAEQSTASLPSILAARQAALLELGALMGRVPANYPREAEGCTAVPALHQLLPVGDGAALIRRRPDIREAERALAAATAEIGVRTAELYPQISLGGAAGFAGPLGELGSTSGFGGSLGPLVNWSFPNRQAVRARIGEAGAAADQAAARFDGSVVDALRQVEAALDAYARELERNQALTRARDNAAKASNDAAKLFRFGRTDILSVLTAQASLAAAETALAQSNAATVDRQVDVFMTLGGGWES